MNEFERLVNEYTLRKAEIVDDDRLSEKGKREALRELQAQHLAAYQQKQKDIADHAKQLQEQKETLARTAPKVNEMTEQQMLQERRELDLLLSSLVAAGKTNFLRTAEQAAAQKPGVFKVAYHQVLDVAEKHFPGQATRLPDYFGGTVADINQSVVDADAYRRGHTFAQLERFYDEATKGTITREEQSRQTELKLLDKLSTQSFLNGMKVTRAIQRVEREMTPTFEEVSASYVKRSI